MTLTGSQKLQNLTRFDWCYEGKCEDNSKNENKIEKIKPLSFYTFLIASSQALPLEDVVSSPTPSSDVVTSG